MNRLGRLFRVTNPETLQGPYEMLTGRSFN